MKNIFKFLMVLALVFTANSCSENADNAINQVFDDTTQGAVLRTISVNSALLNADVDASEFSVTVEEQDKLDGGLLDKVELWARFKDNTDDNGDTDVPDALISTVMADAFSTDTPFGLPRATLTANVGEIKAGLGISGDDIAAGDTVLMRLRLHLTDGRIFDADNVAGVLTGGFYASPFQYNALVTCSPEPGVYHIEMQDTYGDGWQGGGIETDLDGSITKFSIPNGGGSSGSDDLDVPEGTLSLTWTWISDSYNSECRFQIYSPYDAVTPIYETPGTPAPGLLAVTFCVIVP